MEPYITEALVKAGIELGTLTFKGTTTLVNSKIQSLKEERNADKLRNTYDEIVNELLSEREQAIRIAKAYKEEYEKYKFIKNRIVSRKVASYIATMSDTYAENMYRNLTGNRGDFLI